MTIDELKAQARIIIGLEPAAATNARRRNAYPGTCCVCSCAVAAGEGWLYSDTKPGKWRRTGRFPKKVKCDRCHGNGLTNRRQVDVFDNPKPTVRRWSVTDVNKWHLDTETTTERVAGRYLGDTIGYEWNEEVVVTVRTVVNGEQVTLAGSGFLGRQHGPSEYEWQGCGGRPFTPAAWKRLTERVYEAIASNSQPKAQ